LQSGEFRLQAIAIDRGVLVDNQDFGHAAKRCGGTAIKASAARKLFAKII